MRKLVVSTFVTLDGVMQAPGGPEEDTAGEFSRHFYVKDHEHPYTTDPGKPFDPESEMRDREIPARGGGAGLKLVRAWASQIDYQTSEGLNRLSVRLPLRL